MSDYCDRFEHHLLVKVADAGIAVASAYFKSVFPSVKGDYFECAPTVAKKKHFCAATRWNTSSRSILR